MANMRFDVKCVKDCLVNNGVVFTVRSWEGYSASSKVEVDGIGLCMKKRIMRISNMFDLEPYVKLSGFVSPEQWWMKVCNFGACNGWLFEVRVIPGHV